MTRLVDDLMLLAEFDRGPELTRVAFDLAAMLAGLVSDVRTLDPERPIEFAVTAGLTVYGDPDRLTQVFAGLIENARKYTEPGTPIVVRAGRESGRVKVVFADRGPGLTESERAKVFDRFYRADSARGHRGSGLGLSIALAIVTAHGGRMGVSTTPGGGATFEVDLPG